ncbi:MAG: ribose 5-phosphate isomerase B [Deltaproteobacteria bacterium]|jgi:ribose 5-phosphate isomerase B|nr:ribose 5-phosphate isomerase B [Deltaproteobacteria bacterium]
MRISIASDHAGFDLKEDLRQHLSEKGHEVLDLGPTNSNRTDYPDYAKKVALSVQHSEVERGVLVCGSGIGMCITANRFKGVRAVVLHDQYDAQMSRCHNDANLACFGSRVSDRSAVKELLDIFLTTSFEGGRHTPRVAKIEI